MSTATSPVPSSSTSPSTAAPGADGAPPPDADLLALSGVAFVTVFGLLALLAGLIWVVTTIFPGKVKTRKREATSARSGTGGAGPEGEPDPAILAAITSTMNQHYPSAEVISIEALGDEEGSR